jgi:hypothetical protein
MAAPIVAIASSLFSQANSGGGGSYKSAPGVSPGMDPARYGFELWFNRRRRREDQKNEDREFGLKERTVNMAEKMSMQEFNKNQSQIEWLRNFRRALSSGTSGV